MKINIYFTITLVAKEIERPEVCDLLHKMIINVLAWPSLVKTCLRKICDVPRGTWGHLGIRDMSDGSTHQERANSRARYLRLDWYVSRMSTGWRFNALSLRRAPRAEVSLRDIPPSARVSRPSKIRENGYSLPIIVCSTEATDCIRSAGLSCSTKLPDGKLVTILCTCYTNRLSRTFLSAYRYVSRTLTYLEKTRGYRLARRVQNGKLIFLLRQFQSVMGWSRSSRMRTVWRALASSYRVT